LGDENGLGGGDRKRVKSWGIIGLQKKRSETGAKKKNSLEEVVKKKKNPKGYAALAKHQVGKKRKTLQATEKKKRESKV